MFLKGIDPQPFTMVDSSAHRPARCAEQLPSHPMQYEDACSSGGPWLRAACLTVLPERHPKKILSGLNPSCRQIG